MAQWPSEEWTCPACSYTENVHGTMCELCQGARPWASPSVLLVEKYSTRPATNKANARMVYQLGVVAVAEVVRSPESSPDGPLVPPPAAARADAVDLAAEDSDSNDSPPPSRGVGRKMTGLGLGLGESSPTFSPNSSPELPTDNEVSKYSFFAHLVHYMEGNKISEANRAAVEV